MRSPEPRRWPKWGPAACSLPSLAGHRKMFSTLLDFTGLFFHCPLPSPTYGGSDPWGTLCSGYPGVSEFRKQDAETQHEHGGQKEPGP